MNVIHYLFGMPPLRRGGLPKYALSLVECQKQMGHNIKIMVPGPFDRSHQTKIKSWKKFKDIQSYRIFNALPVSNEYGIKEIEAYIRPISMKVFDEWFDKNQSDIIHIHSIMGLPLEFIESAKKRSIKIIMTTHDFFGLCPKVDLMKGEEFCVECDWSKCIECCQNAYAVNRLQFIQSDLYWWYCNQEWLWGCVHSGIFGGIKKILKHLKKTNSENTVKREEKTDYASLKTYYNNIFSHIDCFHFNSRQTEEIFRMHLGEIPGVVIDITNDDVQDDRIVKKYGDTLQLGYIGGKVKHKGFYFLADSLQKIYDGGRNDFICHTFMAENTKEYPFIVNHGPYKYGEQKNVFKLIDVLVVPSMWRETYGMVVLEAVSNGVPVLVSEYVGAKTLVERFPGIGKVFSLKGENFINLVKEIYDNRDMLSKMNHEILKMDMKFDMKTHALEIENLYNAVITQNE